MNIDEGHQLSKQAPARLAAAVIRQAVEDYFFGRQHHSIEALKWINDSPNFLYYCELAGIGPSAAKIRAHVATHEPAWVIVRRARMEGGDAPAAAELRQMIALDSVGDLCHRPRPAGAGSDATARTQ